MMLLHAIRECARGERFSFRKEGRASARPPAAEVASRPRPRGSPALHWVAGALGAVAFSLAGCGTAPTGVAKGYAPLVARFYLEAKPGEAGVTVTLPQSGVTIAVAPKPVLVEYDIANAEVAQVELGRCLLVQLNRAAARDLYRLSVGALDRRLVLALNDQFIGARRIEQALEDGAILVFLEVPEAELPALVGRLQRTSGDLAAAARKAAR